MPSKKQDAIALLKADHKKVKELFDDFEDAKNPEQKTKIAQEAMKELRIHSVIEEEIFYPATRQALGQDESDVMDEAEEEHRVAKTIIEENRDTMVRLAECLLERQSLDGVEIRRILAGLPLDEAQPVSDAGDDDRPQLKEPSTKPLKPILPPITGGNPAPA